MQLTGNIDGFVVISDSLITPNFGDDEDEEEGIDTIHYAPGVMPAPMQPTFLPYPASLKTKNGKYTSTITMGHIAENRAYAVSVVTKKKKLIRKKTVKTRHDVRLTITGLHSFPYYTILPEGKKVIIYDRAEYFGNVNNKITFTVVDFHSVKCPTPVSGTFELPAVVPF